MKNIYRLLYTLPLALILSGCVFDDLSDCPTDGSVSLRLAYSVNGEEAALLPVERADFFVFDAQNRYVCSVTDTEGPFTSERDYRVSLPEGTYSVLSWANIHNDVTVRPAFVVGETLLEEAHIRLAETAPAANPRRGIAGTRDGATELPQTSGVSKFIYHGLAQEIKVSFGQDTRKVIPLKRNTKVINLAVRYNRSDGTPCDDESHHTDAYIRTADGILKSDNSHLPGEEFLLTPQWREDHITNGFNATFYKMILRLDEHTEPEILLTAPGAPQDVTYRANLMTWLKGTGYGTQEALDNRHEYLVELNFTCPHDGDATHTTIRIFVNGWEYVEMDSGV